MLRIMFEQILTRRHLEVGEVETRDASATDERVTFATFHGGTEQGATGHQCLQALACVWIRTHSNGIVVPFTINDMHNKGCAYVEVPQFILSDSVQHRDFIVLEQKVDRGTEVAGTIVTTQRLTGHGYGRPVDLLKVPAFRVWLESEVFDPVSGVTHHKFSVIPTANLPHNTRRLSPLSRHSHLYWYEPGYGCRRARDRLHAPKGFSYSDTHCAASPGGVQGSPPERQVAVLTEAVPVQRLEV